MQDETRVDHLEACPIDTAGPSTDVRRGRHSTPRRPCFLMSPKATAPARQRYLTASAPRDDLPPVGGTKGWWSGIGHPRGMEGGTPPPQVRSAHEPTHGGTMDVPHRWEVLPRMGTKESLLPMETGTPSRSASMCDGYLGRTPYPVGSMSPGVGVPGMTPYGRTLAVRPPVSPSVGTLFSAARSLTHPVPTLPPAWLGRPCGCAWSGLCLRGWLGRPCGRVLWGCWRFPWVCFLCGGVPRCRWVPCLRSGVGPCGGVGLLRLRLLKAQCFIVGGVLPWGAEWILCTLWVQGVGCLPLLE